MSFEIKISVLDFSMPDFNRPKSYNVYVLPNEVAKLWTGANCISLPLIGKEILVKKEGVTESAFFVFLNKKDILTRKVKLEIGIYTNKKKIKTLKTTFLGPIKFN